MAVAVMKKGVIQPGDIANGTLLGDSGSEGGEKLVKCD